jgi:hypothetical protein
MIKLLIGLTLISSMYAFAGTIDVRLNPLDNVSINVDSNIVISKMEVSLNCHWKTTFYQDLGDEANDIQSDMVYVNLKNQSSITTMTEVSVDKHRFSKNKYCLVRFDMEIQSDIYTIFDGSYMTSIKLGTNGNLTDKVVSSLKERTFIAETLVNTKGDTVVTRILLK